MAAGDDEFDGWAFRANQRQHLLCKPTDGVNVGTVVHLADEEDVGLEAAKLLGKIVAERDRGRRNAVADRFDGASGSPEFSSFVVGRDNRDGGGASDGLLGAGQRAGFAGIEPRERRARKTDVLGPLG